MIPSAKFAEVWENYRQIPFDQAAPESLGPCPCFGHWTCTSKDSVESKTNPLSGKEQEKANGPSIDRSVPSVRPYPSVPVLPVLWVLYLPPPPVPSVCPSVIHLPIDRSTHAYLRLGTFCHVFHRSHGPMLPTYLPTYVPTYPYSPSVFTHQHQYRSLKSLHCYHIPIYIYIHTNTYTYTICIEN